MATLALKGGPPIQSKPFLKWPIFDHEEENGLIDVLNSKHWAFNGPKEKEFSELFAQFCGAGVALCVSNGSVLLKLL